MSGLEQWGMPLAVFGMLLAMLGMASFVHRYQAYQAFLQDAVSRLDARARAVTEALDGLGGVPLSRELRVLMRREVLGCYRKIRRHRRRYPAIAERIRAAESAMNAQGPAGASGVGPIEDAAAFRRMVTGLDTLRDVVGRSRMLKPLPSDVRAIFLRELGERRAELMSRYHLVESRRLEDQGRMTQARGHLTTLLQILRQRGPGTAFVRALLGEAESALVSFDRRRREASLPADDDTPPALGGPMVARVGAV